MDKKRIVLPKDAFLDQTIVEGHGSNNSSATNAPETDVEGHGLPITAPPSFGGRRTPGHGGELSEDDDVQRQRP